MLKLNKNSKAASMIKLVKAFLTALPLSSSAGKRSLPVLLLLLFCCQFPVAQATLITLDEIDSGNVVVTATNGNTVSAQNDAGFDEIYLSVGSCGLTCFLTTQETGYLIFDLSGVTAPVLAGSFEFNIDFTSALTGVLNVFDVTSISAAGLGALPTGALTNTTGESLQNDFQSGNLLASLDLTTLAGNGVYELTLSSYAIDLINSTGGLLAIGVSAAQGIGDVVGFSMPSKLNLDIGDATQVPTPGTLALFWISLAGLGWARRRKA